MHDVGLEQGGCADLPGERGTSATKEGSRTANRKEKTSLAESKSPSPR
jgi:hypothetical protein